MGADYGGANDGQCEFSFFDRCPHPSVVEVTFGQQKAWTYKYCAKHALQAEQQKLEDALYDNGAFDNSLGDSRE